MANTTNGAPYPVGTDAGDVPYWMQQLAQKLDDEALAPWTAFTPSVYQGMGTTPAVVSSTLSYARYKKIGKTIIAQAGATVNATTTNGVGIDLPFTARDRIFTAGTLALFGTSTPADQSGMAYMSADKSRVVIVAYTQGFRDATSGQFIRYSVQYELP